MQLSPSRHALSRSRIAPWLVSRTNSVIPTYVLMHACLQKKRAERANVTTCCFFFWYCFSLDALAAHRQPDAQPTEDHTDAFRVVHEAALLRWASHNCTRSRARGGYCRHACVQGTKSYRETPALTRHRHDYIVRSYVYKNIVVMYFCDARKWHRAVVRASDRHGIACAPYPQSRSDLLRACSRGIGILCGSRRSKS